MIQMTGKKSMYKPKKPKPRPKKSI